MWGYVRSLIETLIDVGSGLILATLIQLLVFPLFGLHPTIKDSFAIALILQQYQFSDRRFGD